MYEITYASVEAENVFQDEDGIIYYVDKNEREINVILEL